MITDEDRDQVLANLSVASYLLKKKGSNPRHDGQDEVEKTYKYLSNYMKPTAAAQLILEAAKFGKEKGNTLQRVTQDLCNEHGNLRSLLYKCLYEEQTK